MKSTRGRFMAFLVWLCLAGTVPVLLARKKPAQPENTPNEQRRAVHALNRLTFGPRPGDLQHVLATGVDRWIDMQLHPEKISDQQIDARLSYLRTLHMSSKEIMEQFPDNQMIKQVMDGKKSLPSDPARRAIYEVQIARLQEKRARKESNSIESAPRAEAPAAGDNAKTTEGLAAASADTAASATPADMRASLDAPPSGASFEVGTTAANVPPERAPTPEEAAEAKRREERLYADLKMQGLFELPPDERYRKVMSLSLDEKIIFAESLRGSSGQEFVAGMNPKQREILLAMNNPSGVVVEELSQAKLLRAVYSERQLEEVMTDFWFNHFNVFVGKGPERLLLTNDEQDVIRPRALGKFEDLLVSTAKSPAMLFYLDNWLSVGPNSMQALGISAHPRAIGPYGRPRRVPPNANPRRKQKQSGLNENYGRELLELHTLSVNGGYSQRDVTEVAKVFTGWTIEKPADGMSFRFEPRMHEPGPKFVLGHHIKPKGEDEGKQVLHLLATSPQTAHFISLKLAQRFVSDDPPAALVDRMAKTFEKKKGDIREVLSTLFHSPEFWDDASYRAKVKTPLEFVASAVRATGADIDDAMPLARYLNRFGMPLYGAQPPTGYSMKSDVWVSSSALLDRMNFSIVLTAGKVRGVKLDTKLLAGDPAPSDPALILTTMEAKFLAGDVSKQTHDSIVAQITQPPKSENSQNRKTSQNSKPPDPNLIGGLLLGSPEFQRK